VFYRAVVIQRNFFISRHLFNIVQAPFGISRPILNKAFDYDRLLGLEIISNKLLLGKGFLPRYLFKVQFQNFKEFETTKLLKGFEMDKRLSPWIPIYPSPWQLRFAQSYVLADHLGFLFRLFKTITQTKKHIAWWHWNKS